MTHSAPEVWALCGLLAFGGIFFSPPLSAPPLVPTRRRRHDARIEITRLVREQMSVAESGFTHSVATLFIAETKN
jgi:hypothetical protein